MSLLLGIDIGTSSCKAALFEKDGTVRAHATENYQLYQPHPGWVEQKADEWWNAVCIAVKKVVANAGINKSDIACIGVDGQSWSAIPIDKNGNVLANTPIWMDTRSTDICEEVTRRVGAETIFKVAGNSLNATYTTPKILWFKKNYPDIYKNTRYFLQSNSFIVMKLTGSITQDKSQGYGLHCFDMSKGTWDENLADKLGIDIDKLPAIYDCSQIVGTITAKAATETGLNVGIPVVAGGLDACCGTLGAGVIHTGETQEQGGQAGGMSIAVDKATAHPKLILSQHVVPGIWLLQGGTVGGGGAIRWLRDILFADEMSKDSKVDFFKVMTEEARSVKAGADGLLFLPYLMGERSPLWDPNAQGVFLGLTFGTKRSTMVRSVFEGVAFSLHHNIMAAQEVGVGVADMNAMGGAANSDVWTQIKADVTGKVIRIPGSDTATTLGAAILGGVGTGIYKSFDEAVSQTIRIKKTYQPDMNNYKKYQEFYSVYLSVYKNLKQTMDTLVKLK
jgi:xylulokinase